MRTSLHLNGSVGRYRYAALADPRGDLTSFEFSTLPFVPVRAFLVAGAPDAVRGGHAHVRGQQLLVRVSGEITVEARLDGEAVSLMLDALDNAVLIKAPVWARQTYHGVGARLLVFSDTPFDPQAYAD
ncbi:MAG: hypothetical protein DCF16_01365 [Alphaproteobacteria bacterium]|nr:MAG: hypothetical protein DCF16_01365 [Alphaproteobacteria bacterium]